MDRRGRRRDAAAHRRDQVADGRDRVVQLWASALGARSNPALAAGLGLMVRLAAADRDRAARDRRAAATDRRLAATDRQRALADQALRAADLAAADLDGLTGAYRRDAGFVGLAREMTRATRMNLPLAVAFVDLDGLKGTNDTLGHGAGDGRLRAVADVLRAHLRPYDLVFRYGGDEFVCVLTGGTGTDLEKRLASVNQVLQAGADGGSVSVGVAELRAGDGPSELVGRADAALYERRQRPHGPGRQEQRTGADCAAR